MKKLALFIALLIAPNVLAQCAGTTTCNLSAADNATIQNALNSVNLNNTTITIPTATVTWTSAVVYDQTAHPFSIVIQGQSTVTGAGTQTPTTVDNTVITGQEAFLNITTSSSTSFRVTGITWQVSSTFNGLFKFSGAGTQLRIDHNHFLHMQAVGIIDGPLGVVDHNFFDFGTSQSVDNGFRIGNGAWNGKLFGDGSWADTSQFGTSKFLFFEDNTALNGFINDCNDGGRFVMRHNYFHDATMQGHEMESRMQGCRAYEAYSNTFFAESANQSGSDTSNAMLFRTGTGLIWNNTVNYNNLITINNDRSSTAHGFSAASSACTSGGDSSFNCWGYACNSGQAVGTVCSSSSGLPNSPSGFDGNTDIFGYPAFDQVGRGKSDLLPQFDNSNIAFWNAGMPAWPHQTLEPLYLWLNTFTPPFGGPYLGSAIGAGLFQQNRDWYTDNAGSTGVQVGTTVPGSCVSQQAFWNTANNTLYQCNAGTFAAFYTPYTYPHPLVNPAIAGWKYIQDSVITSCPVSSTCTLGANNVVPTTAGTIWIVRVHSGGTSGGLGNVHITNVTGGGATWHLCPASTCHLYNGSFNDNQDLAWASGGAAGTTAITITLSGTVQQFWGGNFMEIMPPAGVASTAVTLDAAATNTSSSCTTCFAPNLTLTGKDAVIAVLSGNGAAAWNSFSSPYITDIASDGIGLDITSGTGPSVQVTGSGGDFTSIAFTSPLGSNYIPLATPISIVNYTTTQPTCNSNPGCNITIPATTIGNLLYLEAATTNSTSAISSVTGGGSWVIPTGCKVTVFSQSVNNQLSCAYILSMTSSVTSINVKMTGSVPTQIGVFEATSSTGLPFNLDGSALSKVNPTGNLDPPGVQFCTGTGCDAASITGPDIVFGAAFMPGGPAGVSYDPYPLNGANWFFNQAAIGVRTNVYGDEKPVWSLGNASLASSATGVAFSLSAAPPPPVCSQPTISNVVATPAANGTQATITWNTNVIADSLVVFGINNAGNLTPITDTSGTLTHSVTLSNLLPSTQYGFGIRSRAIISGSPCGSAFYAFVDNTQQFTTSAPPTGTADYYIVPDVSPQSVTQGFGVYLGLRINNLVGSVPNNTVSIVVTGLPNNVSLTWTNQQILGVAGTVSTTTVTNDTLKLFQLANTEIRILTNQGGTTTPGAYTLTFTASGTGVPTHTAIMPLTVDAAATPFGIAFPFATPSSYPSIPDLATYKSTATTYGPIHCAQDLDVSPRTIRPNDNANLTPVGPAIQKGSWYYDGVRSYYNVQALTLDGNNYEQCRANIRAVYRDGYIIPNNGAVQVFTMFAEGPYLDVFKKGDTASLNELNLMDAHTYAPGNEVQVSVRYLQREVAYSLKLDIFANVLSQNNPRFSQPTSFWLGFHLDHVLGHVDQICRSQNADYWETFMTGLEADALIDYYEKVNHDIRIPSAIKCLADYIFTNAWNTISDDQGAFQYDVWRGATNFGVANGGASSMVPLNLLIAPMYAWLFSQTGLTQYQTEGDTIWDHGVLLDGAAGGIINQLNQAYPGGNSGKLFSQQYYWGPKYVIYRSAPAPSVNFFPPTINFGNVPVGVAATSQTVTLTNAGLGTLTITGMTLSAPFSFSTSPATNCGGSLAPSATCTITINYLPTQPVVSNLTLSMVSNSSTSPDTVSVNGIGTATPAPSVPTFIGSNMESGTVYATSGN